MMEREESAGTDGVSGQRRFWRRQTASEQTAEPSVAQLLVSLWHDLPGLISDRVLLLALELRRARGSFARMAVFVVLASILAATAWVALWALVTVILLALGVPWYGAFALILVLNGLGAWIAIGRAAALVDDLTLPATMRRLTLAPSHIPDDDEIEANLRTRTGDVGQATGEVTR